jgi:4-hydroxybutyryl-CoA dehydratase/vinylacetyl-CoA-Delta-isomerase
MGVMTKDQYIESLRKLKPTAYMFGEKVENVVDNPRLRAGIEATGATYAMAEDPELRNLIITQSKLLNEPINRFNNPPNSIEDLVARVKINRVMGQRVGTCFQRCTGQDSMCALALTTYDCDKKYGTPYNKRFMEFLKYMQKNDFTANASVTDAKGDRNLGPMEQPDKDVYLHIVEKRDDGIVVRGAKCHQTGSLSSHELIVLPTRAMRKGEEEFAVAFAIPSDTKGVIHVVGRSSMDTRELDGCDCGNVRYSKYAPTVIYDNVFVPWERVFLCGEWEYAADLVVYFSAFHRQSHGGCKAGKIDCMIGAAMAMMQYNGTEKVSHHKEKVIDMIHRAETLYGCSIAASYEGKQMPSGNYYIDPVLANASKIHEGKEMAEATRLMIDIAGGFVADLPSDRDFENPEIGPLLKKYLKGATQIPVEDRVKMFRFIEKMAMESADTISDIHGGGSPAAHRLTIFRESNTKAKIKAAKRLAGVTS